MEITRINTGPCQLFVKLENQNSTGSIKDRVALAMIEAAEREGKLQPGGTIIEVETTLRKPMIGKLVGDRTKILKVNSE